MLQVCLHVFTKIDKHGSICAEIKQIKAFKLSYFEVLQWNNFIYFCPFRSIPLENYMFIAVLKCSQSNFLFLIHTKNFSTLLVQWNCVLYFIFIRLWKHGDVDVCATTFHVGPYTELNISLFHVVFYYRERFVKGWW